MNEMGKSTWGDPVKSAVMRARIPQGKFAGIVVVPLLCSYQRLSYFTLVELFIHRRRVDIQSDVYHSPSC